MKAERDPKTGKWLIQYRYKDWTGKNRKSTKRGFKTKREAEEWLRAFLLKQTRSFDMKFSDFVIIYMDDMKNRLREHTLINKRYVIEDKLLPCFGERRMNEITVADVRTWQNHLIQQGYAPTYLRTIHNHLSTIFNFAVRYYNLQENPCAKAGCIGKNHAEEMKIWTKEEFQRFADCLMDKRLSWLSFQILFWTGMRIGELLALIFDDVDLTARTITINKSYQRLHGEDVVTPPKTPKSNRVISIPPFLAEDIQDYMQSLYVYEKDDRLLPVTKNFLENEMRRGVKLSGVKKIRIHDTRHSHASLLIELGFTPKEIAERLGHENVETTLNTYSHLYPDRQERLANRLDSYYRESMTDSKEDADDALQRPLPSPKQNGELLDVAGRVSETAGTGEDHGLGEERIHDPGAVGAAD
nr:site-specific integrase [Clostridia bacterium]